MHLRSPSDSGVLCCARAVRRGACPRPLRSVLIRSALLLAGVALCIFRLLEGTGLVGSIPESWCQAPFAAHLQNL